MRTTRIVTVRIRRDGTVLFETEGFVGPSCSDVLSVLESVLALKGDPEDIQRTTLPPFYLTEQDTLIQEDISDK